MHMIKVVIATTGTAQPIIPAAVVPDRIMPFQAFIPQNNGSHTMYLGDVNVSTTNALVLLATGSVGGICPQLSYTGDLSEFYVIGTAGDILNIMVLD